MEIKGKTLRNILLSVIACIFLYWMLHETERVKSVWSVVKQIFAPFVMGAILAFIFNVPMRGIERRLGKIKKSGIRRLVAVFLTFLAIILVLSIVVNLLIPQIESTVDSIVTKLPEFLRNVKDKMNNFLNENAELKEWLFEHTDFEGIDFNKAFQKIAQLAGESISGILNTTFSAIGSVTNGIVNMALGFVFSLYCLSRKEILARQGRKILYAFLPESVSDEIIRVLRMANSTFSSFISGQCLEAIILGCLFAVSMLIFRMPYIPLVSAVISITALVPIVGAFVGCVLGAFFILVESPIQAFSFVILFLVLQQIEGNLIYPRVVGTSIGLPGMWVLVAVAVGGKLMGISGMLLMVPFASVLYALAREITDKKIENKNISMVKLQEQPPDLLSKRKERRNNGQGILGRIQKAINSKKLKNHFKN